MGLGDISVAYIDILNKTMRALGGDSDRMFSQFDLNEVKLASPDARVSIPRYMRMGHLCIEQSGKAAFGLEMGRQMSLSQLGLAGMTALAAPDLIRACQCLITFELLDNYNVRGASSFAIEGDCGIMNFYSISPYNEYNHFIVDLVLSGWFHAVAQLTGRDDLVSRVSFEFAPPDYEADYKDYFGCEVLFSQPYNRLELKSGALEQRCPNGCISTYNLLYRYAQQELDIVLHGLKFEQKVSRAISPMLNGNTPSLEQVAEQLNMAPWTVRRRLIDEGVTFQKVLNSTRSELAQSYVKDTDLTLGEIAYLLGFGSATAFQRAFKRWVGVAPGIYRQRI